MADLVGRMGEDAVEPARGGHRAVDDLDAIGLRVLDALPVNRGRPIDRLCTVAGLDPVSVQSALGRLALAGLAKRDAAGWRLVPPPRYVDYAQQARSVVGPVG